MCDHVVWLHLLKQTVEFSKEKLEVLVNFVPENRRSELMPEVVRAAARKFPSSDPGRGSPVKIIWTVQGFDAPETMDMEGYMEGSMEGIMEPDMEEYMEDCSFFVHGQHDLHIMVREGCEKKTGKPEKYFFS